MREELARFKRTWERGEVAAAREMAREYVDAHWSELRHMEGLGTHELVALVTEHRNAGREAERIVTDMWLLARFAPKRITGVGRM